jgi:hypothetical protein
MQSVLELSALVRLYSHLEIRDADQESIEDKQTKTEGSSFDCGRRGATTSERIGFPVGVVRGAFSSGAVISYWKPVDGPEALCVARKHPGTIHLLLTNVVMPYMSAHEVAFQLEQERPNMKVVYMSGDLEDTIAPFGVLSDRSVFFKNRSRRRRWRAK